MRTSQRLSLEQSELREAVNGLLAKDKMSDPEREEMEAKTRRLQDTEGELRAAITLEATEDSELRMAHGGDAEGREFRALETRSNVGNYVSAAMTGGSVRGAELEFNQALKLPENMFPMRLLAPGGEQRESTGVDTVAQQTRWVDRLFAEASAMRLGVTFDSVAPGVQAYPVTTAGATGAQRGKSQATADAVWTVGVTELKPTRNGVRALFNVEDSARLPGLEDALTRDLRAAVVDAVDKAIFLGDATADPDAGDVVGLNTASIGETELTQSEAGAGTSVLSAFADFIDGQYALTAADVNMVFSVGANTYWMSRLVRTGSAVDTTILEFIKRAGFSWSVRGDIADAITNLNFGVFAGLSRGIAGAAVAAVWDAAQLIRDPYSNAAKGEVALTINHLWAFGVPRTANFKRIKFVT